MRICYCFPSRSRPDKFFDTLENIIDNSYSENFFIWCKLDEDDETMNNDIVKERLQWFSEVTVKWGLSKSKIHACNRSMEDLPECDIIVLMSDDMKWISFGFDDEIRAAFANHFPDLSGVVHFPEPKSGNRTMVLTIMGINLYKQLGYLYWPQYLSVYADNDLTEMTRLMGKYVFIKKNLYEHRHPAWGFGEFDEQYKKWEGPTYYKADGLIYKKRKDKNFGIK